MTNICPVGVQASTSGNRSAATRPYNICQSTVWQPECDMGLADRAVVGCVSHCCFLVTDVGILGDRINAYPRKSVFFYSTLSYDLNFPPSRFHQQHYIHTSAKRDMTRSRYGGDSQMGLPGSEECPRSRLACCFASYATNKSHRSFVG